MTEQYQIHVKGHVDRHWAAWFDGLGLTYHDDGTTTLVVPLSDQAAFYGLILKLRDLGVTVLSINKVKTGSEDDPGKG